MRLIDADEIRWVDHYDSDGNLSKYKVAYSDEMPPIVDAVSVVRCKDCKWYEPRILKCNNSKSTEWHPDDYCSLGERKEE